MSRNTTKPTTDGEHLRDVALARVERGHKLEIWLAQLAMLEAMRGRDDRTGSSDDCTPAGAEYQGNAPWIGAAVRWLAVRGLIVRVGSIRSARRSRKGNEIKAWQLTDDLAADAAIRELRRRLDEHQPDPAQPEADAVPSLFD
jgi:hypothetical protein